MKPKCYERAPAPTGALMREFPSLTGCLLPWGENNQPALLGMPGTEALYLPVFSTLEKLAATMRRAGVAYAKVKHIDDGAEFLASLPPEVIVIHDAWFTLEGKVRFLQLTAKGAMNAPRVVTLVGCGKAKLERPAPARFLYTGNLFRAALEHATATSDVVFIVSAKHGLVELDDTLEPYDVTLHPKDAHRWALEVVRKLDVCVTRTPLTAVVVYAGGVYGRALGEVLPMASQPCAHMTIGQRLRYFARERDKRGHAAIVAKLAHMRGAP
jgi:Family of unknown function (DUF6884)